MQKCFGCSVLVKKIKKIFHFAKKCDTISRITCKGNETIVCEGANAEYGKGIGKQIYKSKA